MNDTTGSGRRRGRKATGPMVVDGTAASVTSAPKKATPKAQRKKPAPRAAKGVPDVIVPLRHRNDGWTPIRQRTFLRGLAELGSVTDACKRVGMSRTSAERLRKRSPEFAAAWDKAVSIVAPILEQAAYERGVEGWDEPVFHGGVQVGVKRRYSDSCLGMLYRHRVPVGTPEQPDLATATQAELEAAARAACERAGGSFCERLLSIAEVEASLTRKIQAIVRARTKAPQPPAGDRPGDQAQPSST
ncbi:hypothetical protein [Sphingomonas sp. Leaf357]|uniref:hypothetical protein n=1 Tax=Sphingomonas sp. Leaf357 TaxID=1736350 RepID=UPI000A5A42F5|nr:hypothetical protein [Sphingomonas sp. Leaf357]